MVWCKAYFDMLNRLGVTPLKKVVAVDSHQSCVLQCERTETRWAVSTCTAACGRATRALEFSGRN